MVAVRSGVENFESKDEMRGDVGIVKVQASGFEVENVRGYSGRGCNTDGFAGFDEWYMNV